MRTITWDENYSVGVREMDEQHKRIIQMVNDLATRSKDPEGWLEACADALAAMSEYAATHFAEEEELMATHRYRQLARHHKEHKVFRRDIVVLGDEIASYGAAVPPALLERLNQYLCDWLCRHILETDMQYKTFFNSRGVY